MSQNLRVTIIVAVYNVEKYIKRCIDSLLSQTYYNIEILLVDDGSTDYSGQICDDYAARDGRVNVIHKPNGGVSTARQTGLDAATGDYVIHADPDDWVEPGMISQLVEKAEETSADMITCDFFFNGTYHSLLYQNEKELLKKLVDIQIICVCWNVLVRRDFIIRNNISFTPDWLSYSEDFLFMCRLLNAGAKTAHLSQAFYHYCTDNGNSLVHKKSRKQLDSSIAVISEMGGFLDSEKYDNFFIRKKHVLHYAFHGKFFNELKTLYKDTHPRIIQEGLKEKRGSWDWLLAMALSGCPYKAYIYFRFYGLLSKIKTETKKMIQ